MTSGPAPASHLGPDVLVVLLSGFTLGQQEVHLLLPGLGVVGAQLLAHRHVTLGLPDLVVELGVVQGQPDVRRELPYERLVLLGESDW